MPSITGGHHIALTVVDADRSAQWYCDLLGMQIVLDGDDEVVKYRVLLHPESGWLLGVRENKGRDPRTLRRVPDWARPFRCLGCPATAWNSQAWEAALQAHGVEHSPITETPIGSVVVFRDPDNVQLEFWLPAGVNFSRLCRRERSRSCSQTLRVRPAF